VAAGLDADDPLWVAKHQLVAVHGCETRFLAELDEPFAWTVPMARGTVTHKAVELGLHWRGEPAPVELVDEAIASLSQGTTGLGDWLSTRREAELAELRAASVELVAKFSECFPPLEKRWTPVTETRLRVEVCGGRVVLAGRVDLTLGQPRGDVAGKVLIDLKTGGVSPAHRDDLRFYALLETIRIGTPPRLVATYYLDSGRAEVEAVREGLLDAALARTVDGIRRIAALRAEPHTARRLPGPPCGWCPALDDCTDGQAHLDGR